MAIKDRLKHRRNELDMTLEDVAQFVGVTRATIQKYENGIIANIPSDKIELLAKALQVSPAYLMGWETEELLTHLSEESRSGRTVVKDEMFRLFGAEHSTASLRICGDKVAVLFYKALERHSASSLLDMICAVENLPPLELENIGAVVRAYLKADPPIKEIVDTALKPYKKELFLDAEIG